MKCHVCGEALEPVVTDLPFKLSDRTIVVIRDLPVLQCRSCPEYLFEDAVMSRVAEILERTGDEAELEVVKFAA
ncbi:MAG: YgiT-type zinc finger protein [Planctomycetales bacterium]